MPPVLQSQDIAPDEDFRRLYFTFAVIGLSARVACIDGELTRARYVAFREAFPLEGEECGKIRSLFALACTDTTPTSHYAAQIRRAFPGGDALCASLLERLFSIAGADGHLTREAEDLLATISKGLEMERTQFLAIRQRCRHTLPAHAILGVKRRARASILKARYRELMHRFHPDRFAGRPVSTEVSLLLQLKASAINEAYRALSKQAA